MPNKYWLVARDKPGLLTAMMKTYAGEAHISFEGNLSERNLLVIEGAHRQEMVGLRRNTKYPRLDFVVVPLAPSTLRPILSLILPGNFYMKDIIHIQIASQGVLLFGAYDNFHPECIVCYDERQKELIEKLHWNGVLRSYELVPADKLRWHG